MKIVRYVISTILSFSIIFAVFLMIGLNILDNKLLNKEYMLSKIEEIEFYEQISREVENGFENYIYQSGLPEDTIKELFTKDMIKNDVNSLINCLYDGTEITLSTETLRATLDSRIQEYLNSQNKKLNNEGINNIKKFEDLIVNEYKENVNVSTTLYTKGHTILLKVIEIRDKIQNIPLIVLVVLVALLILVNIKDLLTAINFFAISSLSIGVLSKIGVELLFKNIDFDNIVILSKSLSSLVITILKECIYNLSDNATLYIICGVTGIVITAILKNINFTKVGEK